MLKLPNSVQIRAWDEFTIQETRISSLELMERACVAVVDWFVQRFTTDESVGVVCGPGNNGGDGLGIARLLNQRGYKVRVWLALGGKEVSKDHAANRLKLPDNVEAVELNEDHIGEGAFSGCTVLIDALFGVGLGEAPKGVFEQVIRRVNAASATRVSVDIPSGLPLEKHASGTIVRADYTVSFQVPKIAFFMPENAPYVGRWTIVKIGLDPRYLSSIDASHELLTAKGVQAFLPVREKFAHKGVFGKGLLIAGSQGKMGACILAARAALRSGIGTLTTHIPRCGYTAIQTAAPEAMASVDQDEYFFSLCPNVEEYTTLAVGPGLGSAAVTANALAELLDRARRPMVMDADALNLIAARRELLQLIPANSLLTPHLGELARLIGKWEDDFDRLEKVRALAHQIQSIIIVKGAYTGIFTPDGKVYFNSTGNPGMATGGSGDTLTGILLGLLSQGVPPMKAACLGVYVHGLAGDLAAAERGQMGMVASDMIEALPRAFQRLQRARER